MEILTDRLSLRPTRPSDVPALFAVLGDKQAMRHTAHFETLRACRRHVAGHEWQRRRLGYAPWTIRSLADGTILGWGGLFEDPFDPGWGVELGYWFAPSAWGRGYASELAAASVAEASDRLRLPELRAFARPENLGSCRVLEKAGFIRQRYVPELERHLYRHALARQV
ncbi:Protein N-acetyltransferase, RimJ/RimL family [Bosea sp. CRIB-10]|uniref:GNAT family N-acetyltransferase n=1 Tax=Bosea sp. CRIB-10 TaxID=378404 RepID=UPI0008E23958|nr:GNAT family N-acetyltransferase [Bosea sp. CRIB-10]SFB94722.1 Protein N-acetyltransferase, RimJ/RimL family [Bosea sp. CRIB-10]